MRADKASTPSSRRTASVRLRRCEAGQIGGQRRLRRPATRAAAVRDSAAEVVSQAAPAGQPPTLGGRNGSCPMPRRPTSSRRCCCRGELRPGSTPERAHGPTSPLHRLLDQRGPGSRNAGCGGDRAAGWRGCRRRPQARPAASSMVATSGAWPRPAGTTAGRSRTAGEAGWSSSTVDEGRRVEVRGLRRGWSCAVVVPPGTQRGHDRCGGPPASRTAPGRPACTSASV